MFIETLLMTYKNWKQLKYAQVNNKWGSVQTMEH